MWVFCVSGLRTLNQALASGYFFLLSLIYVDYYICYDTTYVGFYANYYRNISFWFLWLELLNDAIGLLLSKFCKLTSNLIKLIKVVKVLIFQIYENNRLAVWINAICIKTTNKYYLIYKKKA